MTKPGSPSRGGGLRLGWLSPAPAEGPAAGRRWGRWWAGAAALASLAVWLWPFGAAEQTAPGVTPAAENRGLSIWLNAGRQGAPAAAPMAAQPDGLAAMPASLRDTEVPDGLAEDGTGRLVLRREVRDVFDYFLSAEGEETRASLIARLQAHIRSRLKPAAAAEAEALLQAYLRYQDEARQQLGTGSLSMPTAEQFKARLATLRGVRQRSFSPPVLAAFFGAEDQLDDYTAEKLTLMGDAALDPATKAARIAALREKLPATLRDALSASEVVSTLGELTADWRQRSGSPEQLRQLREGLVGPAAADRLEALDRETQQWQDRVSAYLAQRDRLRSDNSLSDSARQQQLSALQSQQFSSTERRRLQTMELMHDDGLARTRGSGRDPRS